MSGTDRSKTEAPHAAPLVVLAAPQMGENIGAAARAMLNFGMSGLRLVNPRDGWPNEKATAMSAGAVSVVDGARVFDTVAGALADCAYVYAATARPRELLKPVMSAEETAADARRRIASGERVGFLFGGERSGLTTDEVALADAILTIPVNPAFASLNLAQAVLVVAYEWARAGDQPIFESPLEEAPPAEKDALFGLFDHLERELEEAGYFYPPEKTPVMMRNIRAMLSRAELTAQEVQTFRGIVKALARGRGVRKRAD